MKRSILIGVLVACFICGGCEYVNSLGSAAMGTINQKIEQEKEEAVAKALEAAKGAADPLKGPAIEEAVTKAVKEPENKEPDPIDGLPGWMQLPAALLLWSFRSPGTTVLTKSLLNKIF